MPAKIKEQTCKNALIKSGLSELDYALNPYWGCEHACIYCYGPYVTHWEENVQWGGLVGVKRSMPRVLSGELKNKPRGRVGVGTVTDPYQPAEKRFEVTRRCLELLLRHDWPICIQTKSDLVLRDIDLLEHFSEAEVGFTLATADDEVRGICEPCSSSVQERLDALAELHEHGIDTWVFMGPIMPSLYDGEDDLRRLVEAVAESDVKYVIVDRLRIKPGLQDVLQGFLEEHAPELVNKYEEMSWGEDETYLSRLRRMIMNLCDEYGLKHYLQF